MGGVVDTCVFAAAERRGLTLQELLARVRAALPEQEIVMSSITAAELVQGLYQGDRARWPKRRKFVKGVLGLFEVVRSRYRRHGLLDGCEVSKRRPGTCFHSRIP